MFPIIAFFKRVVKVGSRVSDKQDPILVSCALENGVFDILDNYQLGSSDAAGRNSFVKIGVMGWKFVDDWS